MPHAINDLGQVTKDKKKTNYSNVIHSSQTLPGKVQFLQEIDFARQRWTHWTAELPNVQ